MRQQITQVAICAPNRKNWLLFERFFNVVHFVPVCCQVHRLTLVNTSGTFTSELFGVRPQNQNVGIGLTGAPRLW